MGRLETCFAICREVNNRAIEQLFNEDIKSVILEDKRRNRWSLLHTRTLIHSIAEIERVVYGINNSSMDLPIIVVFHNLLSLSILSGFDPDDIGFETMFILNAKAFLENETKISGLVIYLFHTIIELENSLGWGFNNHKIDWQEVRKRLRDSFSAFSALCLKTGWDFNIICDKYVENIS